MIKLLARSLARLTGGRALGAGARARACAGRSDKSHHHQRKFNYVERASYAR